MAPASFNSLFVFIFLCAVLTQGAGAQEASGVPRGESASIANPEPESETTPPDWTRIPSTIRKMPRPGFFQQPPTQQAGFHSLFDWVIGEERGSAPKSGYSNSALNQYSFFDADWRYVDSLDPSERTLVESLKRIPLGESGKISVGGAYWYRSMYENNSRLTRQSNDYTLERLRLYSDWYYKDSLRVYGEYLLADSWGEELTSLPVDNTGSDILNLFFELKLFEAADKPVYLRAGRQEMLYGSQRLISPLEWANTRRTFEGVKVFRQGEKWDLDTFWVQPVVPNSGELDRPDNQQNLYGNWATYRPDKNKSIDFYLVHFSNDRRVSQLGMDRSPAEITTTGTRFLGDRDGLLWDFEAMLQAGEQTDRDLAAGAATAGLGRSWKEAGWSPTIWAYYDYASGDKDPSSGDAHTFHHLFPFGHYYMGWMDLVGRQNIHDANLHAYIYPVPWITLWGQYHRFWLDQEKDALYGPGGNALRRDPTGSAGRDVGNEVGLFANFHLTRYSDVMASYNKLYGGRFLEETAGPNGARDAESLYLIFSQRW